jgi:hypothetical protein
VFLAFIPDEIGCDYGTVCGNGAVITHLLLQKGKDFH